MTHKKRMKHRGRKLYRNTHGTIYKVRTKKPKHINRHLEKSKVSNVVSSA